MSAEASWPPAPAALHRLTIDRQALAANWRALNRLSGTAKAGAAVKADCYGLGADVCMPVLRDAGCEAFFVAHWAEVEAIAKHVPPSQIAVLHGVISEEEAAYAKQTGAMPVINSLEQARIWSEAGGGVCHVMVDTGINRLGLALEEFSHPLVQSLTIDMLMSHLASADEDSELNPTQLKRFHEAIPIVPHRRTSLANSAGIALGGDYHFDLTRPGLALYGGIPRDELSDAIQQVAHIEAAIMQIRTLSAGETVGYNAEFTAPNSMPVATVSLGYADGFLRNRGPGAWFEYEDVRLPLIGKVSMDMVVVDLTQRPDLRAGTFLRVPFSLPHAARQSSVSQYELLTTLGNRLKA